MVRQMFVRVLDDLDGSTFEEGSDEGETVIYGFDGAQYEIDLTTKNANKFRDLLTPYLNASRRAEVARAPRTSSRARPVTAARASRNADRGYDIAALREWAAKKKIPVADRGRIKQSIVDQFLSETKSS